MKNGKKLTVAQCKIISDAGIVNPRDYLYIKTESIDNNGSKKVAKTREHNKVMIIQSKSTGEIVRINI